MKIYLVNKSFRDKGRGHVRCVEGQVYDAEGVSGERLEELLSPLHALGGEPALRMIETEFPVLSGGSWYELSNGEKVQGKQKAIEAEIELMRNE